MRSALTAARAILAASLIGYGIMMGVTVLKLIGQPLILFWPVIATAILAVGSAFACVAIQLAGLLRRRRQENSN